MLPQKLAFVDIETTGMNSSYDRIIEIAILRVENNEIIKTYESLINPEVYIPPEIEKLTGISSDILENAPTFRRIEKDVKELLDDCVFVAHNARFDYGFIKNELKRENISFTSKQYCTVKLSKYLFPRYVHHSLDHLIKRHHISCENRHRAYGDAKVLWDFFQIIQKKFSKKKLEEAFSFISKKPSLPINISLNDIDNLSEEAGVYVFYGANGAPLYIGKSINIRDRILSHFSSDCDSSTEMKIARQVTSIETHITKGELGALLLESSLIKEMEPLYNRKLRHARQVIILKVKPNKDLFLTVEMEERRKIEPDELEDIAGVFKSKREAKEFLFFIAKEYHLCAKLLGLEKAKKSCFGYHLGSCKGACLGKEKLAFYNIRVITAITKTKIRPWPFKSAILINEDDKIDGSFEGYLIDKWCYLGRVSGDLENKNIKLVNDLRFDLDVYKIIARYLSSKKNIGKIKKVNLSEITEEDSLLIPIKNIREN